MIDIIFLDLAVLNLKRRYSTKLLFAAPFLHIVTMYTSFTIMKLHGHLGIY